MDNVSLPRELDQFAAGTMAAGSYRDRADVVAAGVSLLQRHEAARTALVASLDVAIAEGEQDGFFSIEEVERDMDKAIAEATAGR